jgi:Transposase IS66 family
VARYFSDLPAERPSKLLTDLFGVNLMRATIARHDSEPCRPLPDFADAVRDCITAAPVKHIDETDFTLMANAMAVDRLDHPLDVLPRPRLRSLQYGPLKPIGETMSRMGLRRYAESA